MIAERELFSFLLRGKFCPFFFPVGQFEMPALFQKKDHKIGEQNKADRLIQVEDVKDSVLDREEADLMRQNYAMFEDME